MLNPWVILALVLAVTAMCVGAGYEGYARGEDAQKVTDQKQFDEINKELTAQKAEANRLLQDALLGNLKLMAERDKLKNQLGEQDVKNRKATAELTARYSGQRLQFRAAQDSGNRANCGGTLSSPSNASGTSSTSVVTLPDEIAGNLRQLARDADDLADAYRLCYGYANQVR